MPTNLVYVASAADPVQVALMGSAVARRGGLLVVRDHPTSADVDQALGMLQPRPGEIFVATPAAGPARRGQSSR